MALRHDQLRDVQAVNARLVPLAATTLDFEQADFLTGSKLEAHFHCCENPTRFIDSRKNRRRIDASRRPLFNQSRYRHFGKNGTVSRATNTKTPAKAGAWLPINRRGSGAGAYHPCNGIT